MEERSYVQDYFQRHRHRALLITQMKTKTYENSE